MNRSLLILALLCAVAPGRALACTLAPPPPRLPGEPEEAYLVRSKAAMQADDDEMHRSLQGRFRDDARRITIGVIESVEPLTLPDGPGAQKAAVRPMKTLKGEQSPGPIILADQSLTTCGWVGGGHATHGKVGEYVIVFEGLELSGKRDQSFGLLGWETRHPDLMKALVDYGIEARQAREGR